MSVLNPYVLLAKTAALAAVVFLVFFVGYRYGTRVQAERDAAKIERKNEALRKAGDALGDAARTFRMIDDETRLAERRADEWREAAKVADQQAGQTKAMFEKRLTALAAEAERERFTCSQAEMRICGAALR